MREAVCPRDLNDWEGTSTRPRLKVNLVEENISDEIHKRIRVDFIVAGAVSGERPASGTECFSRCVSHSELELVFGLLKVSLEV